MFSIYLLFDRMTEIESKNVDDELEEGELADSDSDDVKPGEKIGGSFVSIK